MFHVLRVWSSVKTQVQARKLVFRAFLLALPVSLLIAAVLPSAKAAELYRIPVPGGLAGLALGGCGVPGQVVVHTGNSKVLVVSWERGRPALAPVSTCTLPQQLPEADQLPDSQASYGTGDLAAIWLAEPTTRYDHGILGDRLEAAALHGRLRDGRELRLTLPPHQVFEDLRVRRVDLAGDGGEQFLVVRSDVLRGAALALYGAVDGALTLLAEAGEIGLSHRWLNPVGVADFDGDGRPEAAAVITPHIGGVLTLYTWQGRDLVAKQRQPGFSNHSIGSRTQDLAAVLDWNRDGVPDIALPSARKDALRIVTFAGGRFAELHMEPVSGGIQHSVLAADLDGDGHEELITGTEDGTLLILRR